MGKFVFIFLVICLTYVQSATIHRTTQEIRDFDDFLKKTIVGKLSDPLTPELEDLQNTEERSGKFEGDILLTEEQQKSLVESYAQDKNGLVLSIRLWPNKVVYYKIKEDDFTAEQIGAIRAAIDDIERNSCITFKERTTELGYIHITGENDGCYAIVGYVAIRQGLNLTPNNPGSGCFHHGTVVHEFLHALGFYHMQSTYDRNDWVDILWDNIQTGQEHNFIKYPSTLVTNLGQEYDYGSVMHYSEYGFSSNGQRTIVPIKPTNGIVIGQRIGMSEIDIIRLNKLYSCPGY